MHETGEIQRGLRTVGAEQAGPALHMQLTGGLEMTQVLPVQLASLYYQFS